MKNKIPAVLAVLLGLGLLGSLALFAREQAARVELSAQVESLSAELAAREEAIEALTADAAARGETIESLTADAAAQGEAIKSLTTEAADKDAAIESLTADAADKDAAIESLTTEAADKDAAIESLTADAADKDAAIESLTTEAADKDAAIEALTAELTDRDAQLAALNAELETRGAALDALAAEAADKDAAIEALNAELAGRDTQIEALNAQIVELVGVVPAQFNCRTDAMKFFLSACAEHGLSCLYLGPDKQEDDCAALAVHSLFDYTVRVRYEPESRTFRFAARPCVSFAAIDRAELLELCNALNLRYRDLSFYLDDWDNTVTAESSAVLTQDVDAETAGYAAFRALLDALEENEETFLPYVF